MYIFIGLSGVGWIGGRGRIREKNFQNTTSLLFMGCVYLNFSVSNGHNFLLSLISFLDLFLSPSMLCFSLHLSRVSRKELTY